MTVAKIMLLGEIGVGKSSLVRRLVFDTFDFDYKPTIGVDVYTYDVPAAPNRAATKLIIWDTDGNFGDTIFRHVYMRQASAALIIGDVKRRQTLETMVKLGEGFREELPGRHHAFIVNKLDLLESDEERDLPVGLKRPGVPLLETSAKTGAHVESAFQSTAEAIQRRAV